VIFELQAMVVFISRDTDLDNPQFKGLKDPGPELVLDVFIGVAVRDCVSVLAGIARPDLDGILKACRKLPPPSRDCIVNSTHLPTPLFSRSHTHLGWHQLYMLTRTQSLPHSYYKIAHIHLALLYGRYGFTNTAIY
jgi:hypothetical protein